MLKDLITSEHLKPIVSDLRNDPQGLVIHSYSQGGRSLMAKALMRDVISNMGDHNREYECNKGVLIFDGESNISELVKQLIADELSPCHVDLVSVGAMSINSVEDFIGLLKHNMTVMDKHYGVVMIDLPYMDSLFKDGRCLTMTPLWNELAKNLMDKGIWLIMTAGELSEFRINRKDKDEVDTLVYDMFEKLTYANKIDDRYYPIATGIHFTEGECAFGEMIAASSAEKWHVPLKPVFEIMDML